MTRCRKRQQTWAGWTWSKALARSSLPMNAFSPSLCSKRVVRLTGVIYHRQSRAPVHSEPGVTASQWWRQGQHSKAWTSKASAASQPASQHPVLLFHGFTSRSVGALRMQILELILLVTFLSFCSCCSFLFFLLNSSAIHVVGQATSKVSPAWHSGRAHSHRRHIKVAGGAGVAAQWVIYQFAIEINHENYRQTMVNHH